MANPLQDIITGLKNRLDNDIPSGYGPVDYSTCPSLYDKQKGIMLNELTLKRMYERVGYDQARYSLMFEIAIFNRSVEAGAKEEMTGVAIKILDLFTDPLFDPRAIHDSIVELRLNGLEWGGIPGIGNTDVSGSIAKIDMKLDYVYTL